MTINKQPIWLRDYQPSPFLIDTAELTFILDPETTIVISKLTVQQNPAACEHSSTLELNGERLGLQQVKLNQRELAPHEYIVTDHQLIINEVPAEFTLETTVKIHPQDNFTCSGLYLTNHNFCTQNEPQGFRTITYFLDRPDVLTKFTTTIIADRERYPVLLSNGNLLSATQLENNLHTATWQDPYPKSSYLFALVAGKFYPLEDEHVTNSGRKIKLKIYTSNPDVKPCTYAMHALKQAMSWDEKNFGLEYDLDLYQIVGIDDFNFGAMENKGLNIFNSRLLVADSDTATDRDFENVATVIAHEYFHNWTGNRVTCRDWFQIGLKEGLTTLREQLFGEDHFGFATSRIASINFLYDKQFSEDAGPLAHPIQLQSYLEINNFYTCTVYEKSAEVARMLITLFGRELFRTILTRFLQVFDGKPATLDDFIAIAAEVTQTDLAQFKYWYQYAGTPQLQVTTQLDEQKNSTVTLTQIHPQAPVDFYFPLRLSLVCQQQNIAATQVTINQPQTTVILPSLESSTRRPVVSLHDNFAAPIKIHYEYTLDELLQLAVYAHDPISRWQAGQQLIIRCIKSRYYQRIATNDFLYLSNLFKTVLTHSQHDPAIAAQILTFPPLTQLLTYLPATDIEQLHKSVTTLQADLAQNLASLLLATYQRYNTAELYTLDLTAIGARALKNLALTYLSYLKTSDSLALCQAQLQQADNLTDRLMALTLLAQSNIVNKDELLEQYYQLWQHQNNLVNKWLTLNALIPCENNLERVQRLLQHPGFNLKNPNNVYALIRSFAENNLINFHNANGSGYNFLADQIIAIDKFNSQLAASLIRPLSMREQLHTRYHRPLTIALNRIVTEPQLSNNLYEMVSKLL